MNRGAFDSRESAQFLNNISFISAKVMYQISILVL